MTGTGMPLRRAEGLTGQSALRSGCGLSTLAPVRTRRGQSGAAHSGALMTGTGERREPVAALRRAPYTAPMFGYRSGFMAGDPDLLDALRRFRPAVGVATPEFVQAAAIAAWNDDAHPEDQRGRYMAVSMPLPSQFAFVFALHGCLPCRAQQRLWV